MAITKNVGRQEVIAARVDIGFADIAVAGEFEAVNLPPNAIIVGGYFYDATTGVTNDAVSVEDVDGTELIADMAGTFADGRVDITPTGDILTVPSFVKLDTTGNASAGTAYLHLEYVVVGRAAFSEG
jgi:hypothetical protein